MKRLFFALWPSSETRMQVGKMSQSVYSKDLKKVKADNLHVTLVFLGNVDAELEIMIRQSMKNISGQPFTLYFDQLAFWKSPRVLCLTTLQYDQQLSILVESLKKELKACGVAVEDRLYKPHITLARKARRLIEVDVPPIEWLAQSFCLVESISTSDGVHYQVLQRWNFKSGL
ncbi:MAG: RNA 2',3'-cyclic phosphodiesterase [Methyloprofundus sp.]|nr:RNA 2',3'-cyclic phosphodiesterase [Methyloprofundus sp.]